MQPAPLESKAKKEAREARNKTIFGLIIIFIMVFSTLGYVLWWREPEQSADNPDIKTYNNHTFYRSYSEWITPVIIDNNQVNISMNYLPEELGNVTVKGTPLKISDFKNKAVYLIADDNNEQIAASGFGLIESIAKRMQFACLEEEANETFCTERDLPVKSCSDADAEHAVIIVKETNIDPRVIYETGCLQVKGTGSENLTMASEKALYQILGII